jgi:hypothetical protein
MSLVSLILVFVIIALCLSTNTGILTEHPSAKISEHMKWIDSTVSEAARMKSLVENMLELAKGDFTIVFIALTGRGVPGKEEVSVWDYQ